VAKQSSPETEPTSPRSEVRSSRKSDRGRAKPAAATEPAESESAPQPPAKASAVLGWGEVAGLAVVALIVGAVAGWYGRGVHSGAVPPTDGATPVSSASVLPVGSSSAGQPPIAPECKRWTDQICAGAGPDSEGCEQAKAAANLLHDDACRAAIAQVPGTLERLKQAHAACDELVTRLCKDIGPETESCKMVREKTPQFPTSRCEQLLGQYDDVLAELQQMEKQSAPLSAEQAARQAGGDAPAFGPKDAKVAVVLYSDFQCPYCAGATETVDKIREKYGKKVRLVFRNFPLTFHDKAMLAAEASLAAHAQGKFWAFHDLLFANQDKLDRASLEGFATKAGLDLAAFRKALDDHSYKTQVEADMKLAEDIGVGGTPTMVVGTERVSDPRDFDAVAALIDKQLGPSDG
jgi:protein-disulfide isomerase